MRKVIIAGMLGNGLEWYDYALYGQMAPILGRLFFPGADVTVQLLATFGVFAVGFICRPLGAVLFGWIGDRYGRKLSLVLAILMMAIPTGCIGLLPTYAQIGVFAPALLTLTRILQGLSLGGQFSGSIVFTVEHAPNNRRGLAGSTSAVSLLLGFMLGSFTALAVAHLMTPEAFAEWGWRIPFLAGVVVGLVGFYIRGACDESPAYLHASAEGHISKTPLRDTLTRHPWEVVQGFFIYLTVTMPFYLFTIYLLTYTQKELGRSAQEALLINVIAMGAQIPAIILGAWLSDTYGRKRILMPAAAALCLAITPIFMWMDSGEFIGILWAQIAFSFILGLYFGPLPALLVELFPTSVRYTGMAIAYNLCAAMFGGTAPMVSVWLIAHTGTHYAISFYVMACCVASFIALCFYRERFKEPI